ncbi:MAG TPA: ABC transporter ATP-binding protein [Puia sp.]|jgi:iron(III) transport system ATP-binding protein|nr:ABC transporter ATP-binding protein [Puia sp.]
MDLLRVSGVSARGGVLRDISFSQQRRQKLAVTGATGSGKSTLLKVIAGLVQPDEGAVFFEGRRVLGPGETLVPGHPEIAYLSQHFELWNNYRVEEILSYENELTEEEAEALYATCRIDQLLRRRTDQLSGGERQRIALARLLVRSPRLMLLDEPYSNLDRLHKEMLQTVIGDILDRYEMTCILISHDPPDILSWADEILVLNEGRMVQKATPERIYRQPVDEYVAGLFGKYNRIHPALAARLGRLPGAGQGKDLYIRPEKLTLSGLGSAAAQGRVQGISFQGGYYEVEVELAGCRLLVRADTNAYQKDQVVYVGLTA